VWLSLVKKEALLMSLLKTKGIIKFLRSFEVELVNEEMEKEIIFEDIVHISEISHGLHFKQITIISYDDTNCGLYHEASRNVNDASRFINDVSRVMLHHLWSLCL
jgi:hypothetical protein